jgi:hypothetical protein
MQNTRASNFRISLVLRAFAPLNLLLGVVSAQGGITSERVLAAIIQQTPASILVSEGQQMKRAERAAAAIPGAEAFWGVGDSMEPLYATHTAVVVAPVRFCDLQAGMTVVYLNHEGRMVAHSLTGDVPNGWIAQGVNSDDEDEDLVTSRNLVGVIVQAYSQLRSEFRVALARELIAKGRLPAGQS